MGGVGGPQAAAPHGAAITPKSDSAEDRRRWATPDYETGELVEARTYQPYGATESDYRPDRWKGFREDYGFTGKEEDVEVGLQYFGKRFLSPYLGRWVSADPLAVHAPGSADLNLYAYVLGAVLKAIDPLGLDVYAEQAQGPQQVTNEVGRGKVTTIGTVTVFATTTPTLPELSSTSRLDAQDVGISFDSNGAMNLERPEVHQPPVAINVPDGLEEGIVNVIAQKLTGQDILRGATDRPPSGPWRPYSNGDDALGSVVVDGFMLGLGVAGGGSAPRMALEAPQLRLNPKLFAPSIEVGTPTLAEGLEVADALAWEKQASLAPMRGGFGKKPAVVIGAFDQSTSEASAFASRAGAHAEAVADEAMPRSMFSRPISVRAKGNLGDYADVCTGCEGRFGRARFVEGTTFESDSNF